MLRLLYLTPIEPIYGEGTSTCDLCWEPDYQDIIDAPLGQGYGVPLRQMHRATGPLDTDAGLLVCHQCLMNGSYDAVFGEEASS